MAQIFLQGLPSHSGVDGAPLRKVASEVTGNFHNAGGHRGHKPRTPLTSGKEMVETFFINGALHVQQGGESLVSPVCSQQTTNGAKKFVVSASLALFRAEL